MARQKKSQERILGPYRDRGKWRIVHVGRGGERTSQVFETERQAVRAANGLRRAVGLASEKAIEDALEAYETYLREKGNKESSIKQTMYKMRRFFPDMELPLSALSPKRAARYYADLKKAKKNNGEPLSVDYHRNALAEARTFLKWCATKQGWLESNPLDGVEGIGRRKHGKAQLRIDEARRWIAKAVELANAGEAGAVAALMTLLMGLRASEIINRVVRDLDDGGALLWIPDAKTAKGRRTVQVPAELRPYVLELAEGKEPGEMLFGQHWRDWPREWVQRICKLAKVPVVTAHGMRGLHSTLAVDAGVNRPGSTGDSVS